MPNSLFSERLWAIQPDALAPFLSHVRGMILSRPASPPDKLARHDPSGESALPPAGGFTPHAAFALGGDVLQDRPYAVVNGVAVLSIRGVLSQFAVRTWWGELVATGMLNQIRPAIATALADNAVSAVLLDINSPGGTVAGMKELSDFIASAGKASGKPMAAYANGTMASAAYSIGAATGRVFAPATASVGSIGIISVLPNYAGWNEKMGVSYAYLTAGAWKAVGNEDNPLTDQERAYIQARLDTLYQHFTDGVASGMGLDVAALGTWADGQIFIASAAPQGLVTAIVADLETAIATLAKETTMDKATLAAQHPEVRRTGHGPGRHATRRPAQGPHRRLRCRRARHGWRRSGHPRAGPAGPEPDRRADRRRGRADARTQAARSRRPAGGHRLCRARCPCRQIRGGQDP